MSYGDRAHGSPGDDQSDIPQSPKRIDALPIYDPVDSLKTMQAVLEFVRDIKGSDEYATIVSMLGVAHTAAARILEEELRK